jgi:hypothetical protein
MALFPFPHTVAFAVAIGHRGPFGSHRIGVFVTASSGFRVFRGLVGSLGRRFFRITDFVSH